MANYEKNGELTYIDEDGNTYVLYPSTKIENVDGLPNTLDNLAPKTHTVDKQNPHGVTATQVGALPTAGGTMAGPINMGGNVIWGLGNPTGYDQAIPYRMFLDELAKKAPTGYGLGTVSTSTASTYVEDANTATLTGWYKIDSNTANGIGASAILRVEAYASTYVMQTAIRANGGVISMRYCNNGTWTEWKSTVDYIGALSTSGGTVNGSVNINGAVTMSGNVSYSGGDINMNSRKIWNLATPTGWGDAANKGYVDEGLAKKAPSGYGLGGVGPYVSDCNTTHASGFYMWDASANNRPFDWGTMLVLGRGGGSVQIACGHDGGSRDEIAIRSISNGVSAWQYLAKKFKRLWTNASPSSVFVAQTINLDLSAYSSVFIIYKPYVYDENFSMSFAALNCKGQIETVMNEGKYRKFTVTNAGITFNDQLTHDGSANDNGYCIPFEIYGCNLA